MMVGRTEIGEGGGRGGGVRVMAEPPCTGGDVGAGSHGLSCPAAASTPPVWTLFLEWIGFFYRTVCFIDQEIIMSLQIASWMQPGGTPCHTTTKENSQDLAKLCAQC
jgi:hypothetical protein